VQKVEAKQRAFLLSTLFQVGQKLMET